ncbi:MAG: SRPBCC domain-containing protein, partial [Parafilimonas sp.]
MPTNNKLQIKAGLKILKSADEVFNAIVDPDKMSKYFISKSTGWMETGKTITWQFPEMDMEFPIRVQRAEPYKYISFFWNDVDGTETFAEITLKKRDDDSTFVSITEGTRDNDEEGIK